MKVDVDKMRGALTAIADALVIDLNMNATGTHMVTGSVDRPLNWFGSNLTAHLHVADSLVDVDRGIVIALVHIIGNLYVVVLSDWKNNHVTLYVVDGPKLGLKIGQETGTLPGTWNRERFYTVIRPGLKATYERAYYADTWKLKGKGLGWVNDYMARKKQERFKSSGKMSMAYEDEKELDKLHGLDGLPAD